MELDRGLANRIILREIPDRCNALLDSEYSYSGNGWWNIPSGPWVQSGLPLILFFCRKQRTSLYPMPG